MEQVQHSLSRLALARAIKTTDNESEEESWDKSVIFNQPFIKDLHRQKRQLSRQLEKTIEIKPQFQNNNHQNRHNSTLNFKRHHEHKASSSSGSSLSLVPGNKLTCKFFSFFYFNLMIFTLIIFK
jgi:hypothetical protein